MLSSEWSLVFFTVLVQTSVGMLIVSEAARYSSGNSGRQFSRQAPAALLLAGCGLILSMIHLGTPTHSLFTLFNLGQSWLSREILATTAFCGTLAVLAVIRLKKPERGGIISALTVLLGLVAVFVMSRVYLLQSVPVWNTVSTVLDFFGTMLLTGSVAGGLLFGLQSVSAQNSDADSNGRMVAAFGLAAVLGLALKFVSIPLNMVALSASNELGMSGLSLLLDSSGMGMLILRMILVFAGAAIYGWVALRSLSCAPQKTQLYATICALACILAGELIGRLMFYGTYLRIGL